MFLFFSLDQVLINKRKKMPSSGFCGSSRTERENERKRRSCLKLKKVVEHDCDRDTSGS